jgi:hypothetical protein
LPCFLAKNRHTAIALDLVAERYGVRPSELLRGSWDDLQIDYAVLVAAHTHRQQPNPEPEKPRPVDRSKYLSVRHLARSA